MKKSAVRVATTYTFTYAPIPIGPGAARPVEMRVEETRGHAVDTLEAREIADAVMALGGILCGACLQESRIRFVSTADPTVARCFDCHDRVTTTGAHY